MLSVAVLFLGACDDDPEEDLGGTGDTAVADDADVVDDFGTLDGNGDSYLDTDEIAEWADDVGTFEEWDVDSDSELGRMGEQCGSLVPDRHRLDRLRRRGPRR